MKKIIVANLKMNPESSKEAEGLFSEISKTAKKLKKVKTVFCPPYIYLPFVGRATSYENKKTSRVQIGAQNCFWKDKGAYTGEISPTMLKKLKVKYVMIGHSERRENLKETDEMVNKKIKEALKVGLKIILCVGEKERGNDSLPPIVKEELINGLKGISKVFAKNIIIAYEPIWALSTSKFGHADSPESILEMVIYIRRIIYDTFGKKIAYSIPILYGGSVNSKNSEGFLRVKGVDGLLVGGASLKAREFNEILKIAEKIR